MFTSLYVDCKVVSVVRVISLVLHPFTIALFTVGSITSKLLLFVYIMILLLVSFSQ